MIAGRLLEEDLVMCSYKMAAAIESPTAALPQDSIDFDRDESSALGGFRRVLRFEVSLYPEAYSHLAAHA